MLFDVAPTWSDEVVLAQRMSELEELASTYWWLVVVEKIQRRKKPDYHSFIGSGKLDEIIEEMKEKNLHVLIIGNILKPGQLYNINKLLEPLKKTCRDRVDLILKIFQNHAQSAEAQLQIELAAIKHMWPRIFGMGLDMSRQWWWIGTKWIWETNTERMKRHLKDRKLEIEHKLEEYENMRSLHRSNRIRNHLQTVGLVGYTNAGKSSLMRLLTKKDVLVEDKLFATLWTTTGKVFIENPVWRGKEILLTDTIWFIRDLPPQLIKAFSSTLEDSIQSDILIQVVDCTDADLYEKVNVVNDILNEIWAIQPKVYVFNKIDLLNPEQLAELEKTYAYLNPIFISTQNQLWIDKLKGRLDEMTK